ncbi:GM21110 [Drosophila sechellia]|uniref:GM21110 n=1 Tax=Drosophila sechellia TaxID=7238 RepID=B4HSP8_DROSE|nr:GM21110 [Drosophila sechellia]
MHHGGTNSRPRIRHGADDIHPTINPSSQHPNNPSASLLACLLTKEHRLTEAEDEEQHQVLQRRSPATGSKSMTQEAGDDPFAPFSPSLLVPRPAGPTIKAIKAQEKSSDVASHKRKSVTDAQIQIVSNPFS